MPTPRTESLIDQIGPYILYETVGSGGFGDVRHGVHERTGKDAAVKIVRHSPHSPRSLLQALRSEVDALARIEHPNVVRVLDAGLAVDETFGEVAWFAMTLIEGIPLDDWVNARGERWSTGALQIDPASDAFKEVVRPLYYLARALGDLHRGGIVHRDIKPKNILIQTDGTPIIVDFGVAQRFRADDELTQLTQRATGSPRYMAPEQFTSDVGDARIDLYALGVVIFELFAGRPVFGADTLEQQRHFTLSEPRPQLSDWAFDVPPTLDRLVERLLQKDPRDRLIHADDAADVLAPLAGVKQDVDARHRRLLLRSRFVGPVKRLLKSTVREFLSAHPQRQALIVSGDAGTGRTRTAKELLHRLGARGYATLRLRPRHDTILFDIDEALAASPHRLLAVWVDDAERMPAAFFAALSAALVDDDRRPRTGVLLIATTRTADAAALTRKLTRPEMAAAKTLAPPLVLEIPALDINDVSNLAADALGAPAPSRVVAHLAKDPRPKAVRRNLQRILDDGALVPGVQSFRLQNPSARLPALGERAGPNCAPDAAPATVVEEVLAVLDQPASLSTLVALIERPANEVLAQLTRLVGEERVSIDADGCYDIASSDGDRIFTALSGVRRSALHARVAEVGPAQVAAVERARHLLGADQHTRAHTLLRREASRARRAGNFTHARQLHLARSELLDDNAGTIALGYAEDVLLPNVQLDEAARTFRRARDAAERVGDADALVRAQLGLAETNRRRGALRVALEQCHAIVGQLKSASARDMPLSSSRMQQTRLLLARTALACGEFNIIDRTLAALREENGPTTQAALIAAWSALRRGRGDEALAAINDVQNARTDTALANELALVRVRALFAEGRDADASALLEQLPPTLETALWSARLLRAPAHKAAAAQLAGRLANKLGAKDAIREAGLLYAQAHADSPTVALEIAEKTRQHLADSSEGTAFEAHLSLLEAECHLALGDRQRAVGPLAEAHAYFAAVDDRLPLGFCICAKVQIAQAPSEVANLLSEAQSLAFELRSPELSDRVRALTLSRGGVRSTA